MLLRWVKEAWESLASEIIVRSFKKTGISNMLDGTEEDDLWQPSDSDEENDDDELEFPGALRTHFLYIHQFLKAWKYFFWVCFDTITIF